MRENGPKFRTEGTSCINTRLFLQCSNCDKDIREIFPNRSGFVIRAYYCKDCDDGLDDARAVVNLEKYSAYGGEVYIAKKMADAISALKQPRSNECWCLACRPNDGEIGLECSQPRTEVK